MGHATRTPFDLSRPFVVACEGFPCAGKQFKSGEPFDWQAFGISPDTVSALYIANQIDNVPLEAAAPIAPPAPKQKRQRAAQRATE